jgi:flagellar biosynthesis/type III secretory pathway M-ring protein FliF/YscJ
MCTHLKKHNISDEDEQHHRDETDQQKAAIFDQFTNILYYMVMFIVTAGLSFRTIQNKYFKMLITEYFKVTFSWPGRKKIRKLVNKFATEKAEKIKKKLEEAKSVSITADGWTSNFQN